MSEPYIVKDQDENWLLSPDGSLIYVAGNDGILYVYDAVTGAQLHAIAVAVDLEMIDLSPDGTQLAITERTPRNVFDSPQGTAFDTADVDVFLIDTSTFAVTQYTFPVTGLQSSFLDVAFVDDVTLQLTNRTSTSNTSLPLIILDIATGNFSESSATFSSSLNRSAALTSFADSDQMLVTYSGASFLYSADGDLLAIAEFPSDSPFSPSSNGFEAVWGSGANGRIAITASNDVFLYDGDLNLLANLTGLYPVLDGARSVTFSDDGATLFIISAASDKVYSVDTSSLALGPDYDLPDITSLIMRNGEEFRVSPDNSHFYVDGRASATGTFGIYRVASNFVDTGLITGTDGADQIRGTDGDDVIQALNGDDTIIASPGVDTVDAGVGFDTLRVWMDVNGYFPAFSGTESFVLAADRFYDAAGRVDTTFSNIELFSFRSDNIAAVDFDGSAYVPSSTTALYATNLFFASNSNVIATPFDDFVSVGGSGLILDGGDGVDRLQISGNAGAEETLFITTVGGNLYASQTVFGVERVSVSATNFESVVIFENTSQAVEPTIDASSAPMGIEFRDGVTSDVFIGSDYADVFRSSPANFGGPETGTDTYTGNAGADRFVFGSALERLDNTIITDFEGGDVIELTASPSSFIPITNFIGSEAFSGQAGEYRYEKLSASTLVQFDGDGDGVADGTLTISNGSFDLARQADASGAHNLVLDANIVGTSAGETLNGSAGADILDGLGGDDTLFGFAGDDVLDGGSGNDDLFGGTGDDTYYIDSSGDSVTELVGEGFDKVLASFKFFVAQGSYANVEVFGLTGTAFQIFGDGGGNELHANPDLASKIFAYGGSDTLVGGNGNDKLYAGDDDDVIMGGAGNDRLDGGRGADDMRGGAGNDNYFVDDLGDTVTELSGEGTDNVKSLVNWTLGAELENLRLRGTANDGTGNELDNSVFAVAFGSTLRGLGGDDNLRGSNGDDLLLGNDGDDSFNGRGGADDIRGGRGDDYMRGRAGEDILRGGSGNDELNGGKDDDFLHGGADQDILTGEAGADTFYFAAGDFAGLDQLTADRILDFNSVDGDLIDLSGLDAILGGADDAFTFIGDAAFTNTAGELRFEQDCGNTMVYMDLNGDGVADYAIRLDGTMNLAEADFIL